jgi:hypothetical protein
MRRLSTMLAAGAVLAIALTASGVSVADEHLIATNIYAHPIIKLSEPGNFFMMATLSDADGPLAGKTVDFKTPGPLGVVICFDETDDAGVATCDDPATLAPVLQNQASYVASFAGDETHAAAEERAGLIGE